jgi:hypothetical protein
MILMYYLNIRRATILPFCGPSFAILSAHLSNMSFGGSQI